VLTFNEGVPRAGKSYDAVAFHILPAIKKGRKVFARLDGLDHEAIAKHLKMDVHDVRSLLVEVTVEDVPNLHKIVEPDCLVVIDECHKFYVQSMRPLPPGVEDFFAEHGHAGMDILLISQWYKRLHTALRARVERKNVFQKLSALGMDKSYLVTYWHTTGPDKFEQVGKSKKKYDPAIYPLYHGFLPETENTDVYSEGSITVWKTVLPWFAVAGILLVIGGFFYARFFKSGGGVSGTSVSTPVRSAALAATAPAARPMPSPVQIGEPGKLVKPKRPDMPPEAAYVWGLQDQGRVRLAGLILEPDGDFTGVVEWRADQSRVIDSLTVPQLRALGVTVDRTGYGLRLTWGKGKDLQTIVVTSWPVDEPNRYSQQQISNIRDNGPVIAQTMPGVTGNASISEGDSSAGVSSTNHPHRDTATPYAPPEYHEWNADAFGATKSR
jgi:zona occludens toxin